MPDPTQVDARWQISNLPTSAGFSLMGGNPDAGPFFGVPLVVDQSTGLQALGDATHCFLRMFSATAVQRGVVDELFQQWAGEKEFLSTAFFLGTDQVALAKPIQGSAYASTWFPDGTAIGMVGYTSGISINLTDPPGLLFSWIGWDGMYTTGSPISDPDLNFPKALFFEDNQSVPGDPSSDLIPTLTLHGYTIGDPIAYAIQDPNYGPYPIPGTSGTTADGTQITGGIVTGVGTAVDWSSLTGIPTTYPGYGLPPPILPGDAAGGDLSGTYPNPAVAALLSQPLLLPFTPTLADILTWDGIQWTNLPPPGGSGGVTVGAAVTGGSPGSVLYEDVAGLVAVSNTFQYAPATGLFASNGTDYTTLQSGSAAAYCQFGPTTLTLCDGTNHVSYNPATPANWGMVPPSDVWPALDYLAGQVVAGVVPVGPAGGDLSGSYPNPSVVTVGGVVPILTGDAAGGDLSGTYPNPSVAALVSQPLLLPATPTLTDVLTWDGAAWTNLPPPGTSGPAGGDLSGSYPNPSVVTVGGIVPILTGGTATGDLMGTYPSPTVVRLQGNPVSGAVPNLADVLTWDGAVWAPTPAPAGGGGTIGASVSGSTNNCVLFVDGSGNLGNNASFQYIPANGLYVANGLDFVTLEDGFSAVDAVFSGTTCKLSDGTNAVNASAGNVLALGLNGSTFAVTNAAATPTPQTGITLPTDAFGAGAITELLGTPDAWFLLNVAGTNYKVPAYL